MDDQTICQFANEQDAIELLLTDLGHGAVRVDARCSLASTDTIRQLDLLVLPGKRSKYQRSFSNRRDIWLPTGLRDGSGWPLADLPTGDWQAENVMALIQPELDVLLAGALMPGRFGLTMDWRDGLFIVSLPLETGVPADGRIDADSFVIIRSGQLVDALDRLGRLNRINTRSISQKSAMVAWNSWDWFAEHLDDQTMIDMAEQIAEHPHLKDAVNVICLDAGWAANATGDPTPGDQDRCNDRFANLQVMADRIRELGYTPGIWYGPFIVEKHAEWVEKHPETILWGTQPRCYPGVLEPKHQRWVLDPTHPLVQQKIYNELRWLYEMGFRYFKTDFLQQVNSHWKMPAFHDSSMTPIQAVRRCMHIIRTAIGYDSYWLACGTEVLPAAGLPDASRVSDDIALYGSTIQVAMRHCAAHYWMNGNLFLNDPDFLVVRTTELQHEQMPWMHQTEQCEGKPHFGDKPYQRAVLGTGPLWSVQEARTWANFHIIYGGVLSLGDHPQLLNDAGWAMIDKVIQYNHPGTAGKPLDIGERNIPAIWLRAYPGGWLLGLFNMDESTTEVRLRPCDHQRIGPIRHAVDIWTDQPVVWTDDRFGLTIPSHGSRLLHLQR